MRTLTVLEKKFNRPSRYDRADVRITFDGAYYFASFVEYGARIGSICPLGRGKTIYEALTALAHELEDIDNETKNDGRRSS
jgi:hypothetical protein